MWDKSGRIIGAVIFFKFKLAKHKVWNMWEFHVGWQFLSVAFEISLLCQNSDSMVKKIISSQLRVI